MPITATFGMIFLVAKVDVVGPNPFARSNNKRRLPKGSLFCYSEWRDEEPRKSGADKDERRTEVCRRGETERGRSGNANPFARSNLFGEIKHL